MAGTALIYLFYAVYFGLCKLSCSTLMKTDVLLKLCLRTEKMQKKGEIKKLRLDNYN